MPDVTASRTLVKSAPELWSECSDAESLARHLNPFGEIRITRLEPETAVAWEGEHVSGTVRLQPSGWGTRVVLTATPAPVPTATPAPAPQERVQERTAPPIEAQPAVVVTEPPEPAPRSGLFARLFGRWQRWLAPVEQEAAPVAEPGAAPVEVVPEPVESAAAGADPVVPAAEPVDPVVPAAEPVEPVASAAEPGSAPEPTQPGPDPQVALLAALDSLGRAHHRPYSRA